MENRNLENTYDVIIIGAGVAGMTAAQYAARSNLSALVLEEKAEGGQAIFIDMLENYPGFAQPVNGVDFSLAMKSQAENFGAAFKRGKVLSIEKAGNEFSLLLEDGEKLGACAIIIATGAEHRKLGVPGEEEYFGGGVSYCAACDGPFFRNKRIAVIGGGDAACDEAEYLSRLTDNVIMIHRKPSFRAQKAIAARAMANPSIKTVFNTVVEEIKGADGAVSALSIKNVNTGERSELACDAVFIFVGMLPQTELVTALKPNAIELDESGYIVTDESMATSVAGIFAAGDIRKKPFRQIITAASDGAVAAHSAAEYISSLKA